MGNLFVEKKRRIVQFVPKSKRRCCFTHVALICDDTEIQPLMPQVLVGSESTVGAKRKIEPFSAKVPFSLVYLVLNRPCVHQLRMQYGCPKRLSSNSTDLVSVP